MQHGHVLALLSPCMCCCKPDEQDGRWEVLQLPAALLLSMRQQWQRCSHGSVHAVLPWLACQVGCLSSTQQINCPHSFYHPTYGVSPYL
jgi:hypothetical protein